MSWGTAYSGSNNLHFNFPPVMEDGRTFSSWVPGSSINDQLKATHNIQTNWDYRQFLTHNSSNIVDGNLQQAFYQSGYVNVQGQPVSNSPFLFSSVADKNQPYGYEESDLKNIYMSREALQSRMVSPVITQDQMLMQRMANNQ
jgi:hypothetical protein